MNQDDKHLTLNTGARMPRLGLGTWKSPPDKAGEAVVYALQHGYHHIDCAAAYGNEKEIGGAFKKVFDGGSVKREEVFITSKLWNTSHRKNLVRGACEATLADLQLRYLDLYLMHWGIASPPEAEKGMDADGNLITDNVSIRETWEAMEELVSAGLVKAIGVANFTAPMLLDLLSYAKIPPAVNQIELHPYFQQSRLLAFCQHRGIVVTAYSPLGSPGNYGGEGVSLLNDSTLVSLAQTHVRSPAQIAIRWGMQRDTVVIPKSIHPERISENGNVFDFELAAAEMEALAKIDRKLRYVDPYTWGKIPYFD